MWWYADLAASTAEEIGELSMTEVELSVVVAPVLNGSSLEGCLNCLRSQIEVPALEVIVPVDGSVRDLEKLEGEFPEVTFLWVESIGGSDSSADIGTAHLAIDRRRAAGLAAAHGRLIAMTEEHGRPDRHWCRAILDAHLEAPNAVIGGAIRNVRPRPVNWALFFMDGGRYQNPVKEDAARYVSDVNVSYKREALQKVKAIWRAMYDEVAVHNALASLGEKHLLRREIVMGIDRGHVGLSYALAERLAWARLYAARRVVRISRGRRILLILGTCGLPGLLLVRQVRLAFGRGRNLGALVRCFPILVVMDLIWALGEAIGYTTGIGTSSRVE